MLAKQLLEDATDQSKIAVVSAPSVFVQVKNLLVSKIFLVADFKLKPH